MALTVSYQESRRQVEQVVERFARNLDVYRRPEYKETQVRVEFIAPFFEALGWDVRNTRGYSEQYKDVVHEDAIKVGGATRAPDYCFRVGGTRKFFLEAKKPSVSVRGDVGPAYQLRRYAWSAKLPLSILTDFEELAVYDCRQRPRPADKAGVARVNYLGFEQYLERFDEIYGVFAREAILQGAFDRYVEDTRGKRGTSEVDAEFLREIEGWRDALARNIALRNPVSVHELNFAVQHTIDRIVFLRMAEDRGLEIHGRLLALCAGRDIYPRLVSDLYRQADEKYNSGLFDFQADRLTPNLTVDDRVLKPILEGLYYPDSPYEFSVLPAEVLGQVYEQFLGKVIRLTAGHRAVVEEKPEVKKAGGVYYTPAYIVDYIVEQTVGKLVEGKSPRQLRGARGRPPLRILDMACGSGSFLLGAYQYLLDYYRNWYEADGPVEHARGKQPALYQGPRGDWRLTSAEKKRILLDHIYGVDIDRQAVEVTKLSLLLKVLEGETEETLNPQLFLLRERALPDLANNIKCGNSLIGPDYYAGQLLPDEDEMRRVNPFDWQAEFPEAMAAGGFDAIIGNPPYIRIQRIDHAVADYLFSTFQTPTSKTDLSQLFLEQALRLTNQSGLIGYICTSQWLSTDYGKNMRRMLSDGRLHKIIDFGSLPVFQNADTYPAIFILSPSRAQSLMLKRVERREQLNLQSLNDLQPVAISLDTLSEASWNLGLLDLPTVLSQRGILWQPLQSFARAYIGLLTGMDKAFVVAEDVAKDLELEDALLFPYAYRGAEVERYSLVRPKARVIYPYRESGAGSVQLIPEAELKRRYPRIYQHLLGHKSALRGRKDSRRLYADGSTWYCHLRPGSFDYIHPAKFIIKGIDNRTTVGLLDGRTAFNGANCPAIILGSVNGLSPLHILGILNSRVVSYHLRMVCPPKLGGYSRFNATSINQTPIPLIDFSDPADVARHDRMVALVECMLDLHKKLAAATIPAEQRLYQRQIEAIDRQIDALVYELYGLSAEEIAIVEDASK